MDSADKRHRIIAYTLITFTAIALGYWFYFSGAQGLYFDARGYYDLGVAIRRDGFWSFSSELRTYGYPLFVALASFFTDGSHGMVRFAVFNLQLGIYLAACFAAARMAGAALASKRAALALYAVTALNPLLLVYTTEVLTDLLSAVLILLAVLGAVFKPPVSSPLRWTARIGGPPSGTGSASNPMVLVLGSFFIAGLAAVVRPANATIVVAVLVIWVLRAIWLKEVSITMGIAGAIGLALPFVPQLYFNYRDFNVVQPLIVHGLYAYQMDVGAQVLKYATVVIPDRAGGLAYPNPFLPAGVTEALDFVRQSPAGYALTAILHAFMLFDHDFIFPYIADLHPWYRGAIATFNYVFLFTAAYGVVAWVRAARRQRSMTAETLLGAGLLIATGAYISIYVLTAVENRFSLPVYLLASPFVISGARRMWALGGQVRRNVRGARAKVVGTGLALVVFIFTSATISAWLREQVPVLQPVAPDAATAASETTREVGVRFGEQIQLLDYRLQAPDPVQGGSSVYLTLGWNCNGASTDAYEVQVRLTDAQGHVPAHAFRFPDEPVAPCPARFWEPRRERGDMLTLELSPALAGGDYKLTVGLFDHARGQYLDAVDARGASVGSAAVLATVRVMKNRQSIPAGDLQIGERLYVDMREMRFLGYTNLPELIAHSETLQLGLYWRARGKPQGDYVVAVQLRDASGSAVLEQSARPAASSGSYPTYEWSVGEVLLDWHDIVIPDEMPAGKYAAVVVLREAGTGQQLGEAELAALEIIN